MKYFFFWLLLLLSACTSTTVVTPTQLPTAIKTPLTLPPTWTATPSETPTLAPKNTPTTTPSPTPISPFSDLSAEFLFPGPATFQFTYNGDADTFIVHVSTLPNMESDVYLSFARGEESPVVADIPTQWDKYTCGNTLYWRVLTDRSVESPVQSTVVHCAFTADTAGSVWAVMYQGTEIFTVHRGRDTMDGGILLQGSRIGPNDDKFDNLLIKLNADGSFSWQKVFPETFTILTIEDTPEGIRVTGTDGKRYLSGQQGAQGTKLLGIVEINLEGTIIKNEGYSLYGLPVAQASPENGGTLNPLESEYRISRTPEEVRILDVVGMPPEGGAILSGAQWGSVVGGDGGRYPSLLGFWAFRVDQEAQVIWQKMFEGSAYPYFEGMETRDHGLALSGKKPTNRMLTWIAKFDVQGNPIFWKYYALDALGFSETPEGGFLIWERKSGTSSAGEDNWLFKVVKIDPSGELVWVRQYEGLEGEYIYEREAGGFVLTARHGGLPLVLALDETGNLQQCTQVFYQTSDVGEHFPSLPNNVSAQTTIHTSGADPNEQFIPDTSVTITDAHLVASELCRYTLQE